MIVPLMAISNLVLTQQIYSEETNGVHAHNCGRIPLKQAKTVERNSTMCECIFHQVAVKNVNVKVVKTIYCQCNLIFRRQKNSYSIPYLTGQNRGLSGLKNIWPAIMTGDLLSVIFSPETSPF